MKPIDIEAEIRDWQQRRAALKAELAEHPERYSVITEKLEAMDAEHHRIVEAARQPAEPPRDTSEEEEGAVRSQEEMLAWHEEVLERTKNEYAQEVDAIRKRMEEAIASEYGTYQPQDRANEDFNFDTIFPSRPAPKPPAKDHYNLSIDVSASNADDLTNLLEMALYEVRKEIEKQKRDWLSRGPIEAKGAMDGTVGSYKTSLKIGSKPDEDEIPY